LRQSRHCPEQARVQRCTLITYGVTWIAGEWAKYQVELRQRVGAEVAA